MTQAPSNHPSPANPISAALDRLWARFLPEIEGRVAVLAAAADALANGALPTDEREAAHAAAHKLAGSLGTFGLKRGTEIARWAEVALGNELPVASPGALAAELAAAVTELQTLIGDRG